MYRQPMPKMDKFNFLILILNRYQQTDIVLSQQPQPLLSSLKNLMYIPIIYYKENGSMQLQA